ncbi:hypothetical protein F4808DRAFT_45850 [Astrocystis sublimbata]|nr:hypothetical protein F4808DRAFT_45850 [Astrocystis sublimbata]
MSSNPRRTGPLVRLDPNVADGRRNNLALLKGATFHAPISPPSSPSSTAAFKVPSLPRRSQTTLDDVVGAHVRRAALNIGKFEDSLTAIDKEAAPGRPSFRDDSLPVPRGFLKHTVMTDKKPMKSLSPEGERRVLQPHTRRSSHRDVSDSGLGTSVASTAQKRKEARSSTGASAITRSANASKTESLPGLSRRAVSRINEHVLRPLLAKPELEAFKSIVLDCPRRISENQIICLRDLEKTLIFMAPERANSAKLYLDFCTTSIRCIQATVEYLSDRDQTRPGDRPYTSGYFIDLFEQIRHHAQQLRESRDRLASGEDLGEMDVDPYVTGTHLLPPPTANQTSSTDEVKLIGGITITGRPAELVRVKKNGKAISLATGELVEDIDEEQGPVRFKRSMSQQAEDEEEIMRSMARRKKNATPEELAPKKCNHPGCNKEFKRPCDLTKHEKTHSRPWKCPIPTCKFHEYGWPTEKEMARHVNDKHSAAPAMYECDYKPCPYKSKRESNCKQHMEKAHGWTYKRSKVPKTKGSKAGDSVANATPVLNNLPTPSSEQTDPTWTPDVDPFLPTFEDNHGLFPTYPSSEEFNAGLFDHPGLEEDIQLDLSSIDNGTPLTDDGQFNTYQQLSPEFDAQFEDIYGAHVRLPTPNYSVYDKTMPASLGNYSTAMCPPVSTSHFSPSGHGDHMLRTPISMAGLDEGYDDGHQMNNTDLGGDFTLFPSNNIGKASEFDPNMFATFPPSMTAGYPQLSSHDLDLDFTMDWAYTDMDGFPHQQ